MTFPSALELAEPKPTRVRDVAAAYDVILRTRHVYQPQESSVKPAMLTHPATACRGRSSVPLFDATDALKVPLHR